MRILIALAAQHVTTRILTIRPVGVAKRNKVAERFEIVCLSNATFLCMYQSRKFINKKISNKQF